LVAEVLLARGGGEVGGGWSGHGGARRSRRRRGLGFPCSSLSLFMEFRSSIFSAGVLWPCGERFPPDLLFILFIY
jgi:hypothetical protein